MTSRSELPNEIASEASVLAPLVIPASDSFVPGRLPLGNGEDGYHAGNNSAEEHEHERHVGVVVGK